MSAQWVPLGSPRKLLCLLEQKNNIVRSQLFPDEGVIRRVCYQWMHCCTIPHSTQKVLLVSDS